MSQYLLSVHASASDYDLPPEEAQPMYDATEAINQEIIANGTWVFGGGLKRIETATTVDGTGTGTGGDVIVTDGPFAETKEYLGGFGVIEVPDLDAALKIAARASKVCQGKVEVRPFEGE